ncbi:putative PurR-regulated permease PerM [Mesorhizobium sangaii]|uniref:Putative PurR-regulated permease PerM n=1 Tax=Mesorhizobium sangaii TaxID=505389 RepID=A0A841PEG0_9HYPH|nr:putative PurR-regulated permease PerM [Mesorhizobium sangaii]
MKIESAGTAAEDSATANLRADTRLIRSLVIGIFLFMVVYALFFAQDFFVPVILAFLLALTLRPVVRFLKKHGVQEAVSATILVLLLLGAVASAGYLLSDPIVQLISNAPSIGQKLSERLSGLKHPFERFLEISHQVESATDATRGPDVQKVAVAPSGLVSQAAGSLLSAGTRITIIFVLSLFILASGTMFYEKIIQSFPKLSDKKRALQVAYDVEREISRYLFTVAVINIGLGSVIALGLWALGMPSPLLWGAAAALLNFLPYIGALVTIVLVAVIGLISFDTLSYALLAPAFVLLCDVLEGQFRHRVLVVAVGVCWCDHGSALARRNQGLLRSLRGLCTT